MELIEKFTSATVDEALDGTKATHGVGVYTDSQSAERWHVANGMKRFAAIPADEAVRRAVEQGNGVQYLPLPLLPFPFGQCDNDVLHVMGALPPVACHSTAEPAVDQYVLQHLQTGEFPFQAVVFRSYEEIGPVQYEHGAFGLS